MGKRRIKSASAVKSKSNVEHRRKGKGKSKIINES